MTDMISCECLKCHYNFELKRETVNKLINGELSINCPDCGVDLKFTEIIEDNFAMGSPI